MSDRLSRGLENPDYRGGLAPQLLKVVIFSLGLVEDMHYNRTEIEEHPP